MKTGAVFDQTGQYRYALWREWDEAAPGVGFVMLNPSRADAVVNDPTIRRCLGFAQEWGFGRLEVMNLFAYRTAKPVELWRAIDPVGAETDAYLQQLGQRCDRIVAAWGNGGKWLNRDRSVLALLTEHSSIYCLGTTQQGHPKHPLYLKRDLQPTLLVQNY